MTLHIHRLKTSHGVPIYFEQYPLLFQPASMLICMFAGGADDVHFGAPGLHHWGEHLPFRGTFLFPNGNTDISGFINDLGGMVNAYTGYDHTAYYATMPKSHWRDVATRLVDLVARPLNRPEDIEAERTIIGQEINQRSADVDVRCFEFVQRNLWGKHPLGSNIIGTHESLAAIDPALIGRMHLESYGRQRCAIFIAGSMDPQEVLAHLESLVDIMPGSSSPERRSIASYGPMPAWRNGEHMTVESEFDTTVVSLAFPLTQFGARRDTRRTHQSVSQVLGMGSFDAPLQRTVREERKLAYHVWDQVLDSQDGDVLLLQAKTSRENVGAVTDAFWDVLALPEIRSAERFERMQKTRQARLNMHLPNPKNGAERLKSSLCEDGDVSTAEEHVRHLLATPHREVLEVLDTLTKERGRVLTLLGTK